MVRPSEVLIVGGGPAGCAAARLLALWGHAVRLIARPPATRVSVLPESIPPSCDKLFGVLGVTDAIDAAGFLRSTGNTVWWGSREARIERFAGGARGWQVTADALAGVLLERVRSAGAIVEGARAEFDRVAMAAEPIVLDCTGRTGLVARARGWRVYDPALRSVALVGRWTRERAWDVPDATQTLIESYADGWLWSIPAASGARYIAAMIDPRASSLEGDAVKAMYLAEIAKAPRFSALVRGATCDAGPWGFDASMYSSRQYADDRVLLVGDAASFVDPLSSVGVKKALASGWLAAVAAHTALRNPAMRRVAFDFFAAREQEMYGRFRALTRLHLARAAPAHAHPFWSDREFPDSTPDDDVERAYARLRSTPSLHVARGTAVIAERPAVSGCEIVFEPRLVDDAAAEGVRYLHGVDVVVLVDLAPAHSDVGKLFGEYARRAGPVTLHDFLLALATALARGWLLWE